MRDEQAGIEIDSAVAMDVEMMDDGCLGEALRSLVAGTQKM